MDKVHTQIRSLSNITPLYYRQVYLLVPYYTLKHPTCYQRTIYTKGENIFMEAFIHSITKRVLSLHFGSLDVSKWFPKSKIISIDNNQIINTRDIKSPISFIELRVFNFPESRLFCQSRTGGPVAGYAWGLLVTSFPFEKLGALR